MATYLAYTSPARGHLYPVVPTLLELRARGHDVHVRTLASEVDALRAAGLQAAAVAPAIERLPLRDFEAATPEEGLVLALTTFAERARHELADMEEAIEAVDPDVLLVDITTPGAAAVAEAAGLAWGRWIPLFQHASAPLGAAADITLVPFALAPLGIDVLNAPRKQCGLQPVAGPDDVWRAPLHLYYTAPPFEPEELPFPPTFRLVGPGVWEPPADAPAWFDDMAEPLVLVTVSSELQTDRALIETALEGLRSEPVRVVITTAANDPAGFAATENARLARWLPHQPLIGAAECVVCHGGMGITQKALAAGVPVCVVPFGRDQLEVAARVSAVGAGTVLSPCALDPSSLRRAVREAMEMRAGAQQVARSRWRAALPARVGRRPQPTPRSGWLRPGDRQSPRIKDDVAVDRLLADDERHACGREALGSSGPSLDDLEGSAPSRAWR